MQVLRHFVMTKAHKKGKINEKAVWFINIVDYDSGCKCCNF